MAEVGWPLAHWQNSGNKVHSKFYSPQQIIKTFTPALLLLCATALCITSTAGSYNHGHHLLTPSHGQSNSIHKRQIDVNQLRECQRIILQEQCNNGLLQESVNLALQCNLSSAAADIREGCRRNSAGDYCAVATIFTVDNIVTVALECSTNSSSVCTPRCQNLLTLIRGELGCCINVYFNNSASLFFTPGPFLNSVWTRCGVEPITEQCTPSTIELPQVQVDPTCTTAGIRAERAGAFQCSRRFLQPIIDALMDVETCQIYAQSALEQCGVDESGTPCYEQFDALFSSFRASLIACSDVTTCAPSCAAALQNFANTGGCCINNFFNGTLAGITTLRFEWLSSQFWEDCGIETPGLCEPRLNGAVFLGGTATIVAITSAIVLLLGMLQ